MLTCFWESLLNYNTQANNPNTKRIQTSSQNTSYTSTAILPQKTILREHPHFLQFSTAVFSNPSSLPLTLRLSKSILLFASLNSFILVLPKLPCLRLSDACLSSGNWMTAEKVSKTFCTGTLWRSAMSLKGIVAWQVSAMSTML